MAVPSQAPEYPEGTTEAEIEERRKRWTGDASEADAWTQAFESADDEGDDE